MRWLLALVLLLTSVAPVGAQGSAEAEGEATLTLYPDAWLALPAVPLHAPALSDEDETDPFGLISLPLAELLPSEGEGLRWPGRRAELRWSKLDADAGEIELGTPAGLQLRVLALYLEADAFVKGKLLLRTDHRARVFLDAEQVLTQDKAPAPGTAAEEGSPAAADEPVDAEIELEPGQHRLLVLAVADASETGGWELAASLELASGQATQLRWLTDPRHRLGVEEFLDMETVTGISVSPNGDVVAVGKRAPQAPSDDGRSWVDFVSTKDGTIVWSLEGIGDLDALEWAPAGEGRRYAFVTRKDGKATVWLGNLDGGSPQILLEDVEHFGGLEWMPDGSGLVTSVSEEGEKDPENVKRYRGLTDRWSGSRDRSFLYQVAVPSGAVRRLTAGETTTSLQDIAPDGGSLLFTRTNYDDAVWPFARDELFELDLESLVATKLVEAPSGVAAQYSPDGRTLLLTASPSAFGEDGENVPEGRQPNLYDTQAYLMDRAGGAVRPITRDFDPSIDEAVWSAASGDIVARATDRSFDGLFRYDVDRGRWEELQTPLEVVRRLDLSADGRTLVFQGNSTNTPWRIFVGSLQSGWSPKLIEASDLDLGGTILTGRVEDFDFEHGEDTVRGRIYYPPQFDATATWPAIVYYYGGTSPVSRDFGGRYPKELWAAHGYVVYVLQPSGATGFGQEFSSRHVNNWGVTVADEIIAGTRAFLGAHPFVDPDRVGCIGASYGGFMTMLLTTRTDIYAAAISHAGISSLSSYWGEGNWGYIYSAAATAHSYPWNRPDLYVDQSPLFAADQIVTPLLLLHGSEDDNVPPGESEQMYTALRVLGKEVEYIRVSGERHWILQYDKRRLWTKTIVAWFDRWLKDDPGWWDHLYGEKEE